MQTKKKAAKEDAHSIGVWASAPGTFHAECKCGWVGPANKDSQRALEQSRNHFTTRTQRDS